MRARRARRVFVACIASEWKKGIGNKIFPLQIEECFFVIFLTFNEKILFVEPQISILHEPHDCLNLAVLHWCLCIWRYFGIKVSMSYPPRPPGMNLTPGQMPVPPYMTGYIQNSIILKISYFFLVDLILVSVLLQDTWCPVECHQ